MGVAASSGSFLEKMEMGLCFCGLEDGRLVRGETVGLLILAFWPRGGLRRREESCLGFSGFGFEDERKCGNGDGLTCFVKAKGDPP